jgi:hypothetical protein
LSRLPGHKGVYARLRGLCPAMTQKGLTSPASLAADKVDQGRHAGVPGSFPSHAVVLGNLEIGKIRKGLRQHGFGVEVFNLRGPAGLVGELLGPVALLQQQTAALRAWRMPAKMGLRSSGANAWGATSSPRRETSQAGGVGRARAPGHRSGPPLEGRRDAPSGN